jgi:hypothetical protein
MAPDNVQNGNMDTSTNQNTKIWLGIAIGAAVGIGIALSRRKRSKWDTARHISSRVADHSSDLADMTSNLMARVRNIYDESCKVVEEANHLWANGRKLVGY